MGSLWGLQFLPGQGIFFRVEFENKVSWTFAIQNTFKILQVLSCPDWPTEGRVAMLKLLAFGAEQDDIVLILHMDRWSTIIIVMLILGAAHKWRFHFWGVSIMSSLAPPPLCTRKWQKNSLLQNSVHRVADDYLFRPDALIILLSYV